MAFQAHGSPRTIFLSAFHLVVKLHQPATSPTTSQTRRHQPPTPPTWAAWDRPIYVTTMSLNILNGFSTSGPWTIDDMATRVGIRLPFPFLLILILLIIQQTIQYSAVRFFHLPLSSVASAGSGILFTHPITQQKTTIFHTTTTTTTTTTSLPQP